MKLKLLALALGVAALSSSLVAKDAKALIKKGKHEKSEKSKKKHEKSESSETRTYDFFGASDTSPITLVGPGDPVLTFTQFQFHHGKGITPNSTGSVFTLDPGTYYVTFTGTFEVAGGTADYTIA